MRRVWQMSVIVPLLTATIALAAQATDEKAVQKKLAADAQTQAKTFVDCFLPTETPYAPEFIEIK